MADTFLVTYARKNASSKNKLDVSMRKLELIGDTVDRWKNHVCCLAESRFSISLICGKVKT
jgi:hypothetical protein